MTVPGRPILFAAMLIALLLLAAVVQPEVVPVALTADALLIALVFYEGRRLRNASVHVTREDWARVELDRKAELKYRVENRGSSTVWVCVHQPWPDTFDSEERQLDVRVEPGEAVIATLSVTPRRRGRVMVEPAAIDVRSGLGLARRRWTALGETALSVFPNLKGLNEYEALRRAHALTRYGIHNVRMIGAGREFDQLRDYVPDDDFGNINWKATARHRKPITNLYQAERSQDVMLCVDCGRMMGNPTGQGTALDRAVDACLMLSHVANRSGDRVGLALFRESVTRFLKPAAGAVALSRIVQELVDAHPQGVFPSYSALATAMRAQHPRRSIVFIFTDLNDPQLVANLVDVVPLMSRRHVVVVVGLYDPLLRRMSEGPASDRRELYQVIAAGELSRERQSNALKLAQAGVSVLESDATALTLEVINRYLSIKQRQMV
jgi:uncharacterized protein (DUF58 family)